MSAPPSGGTKRPASPLPATAPAPGSDAPASKRPRADDAPGADAPAQLPPAAPGAGGVDIKAALELAKQKAAALAAKLAAAPAPTTAPAAPAAAPAATPAPTGVAAAAAEALARARAIAAKLGVSGPAATAPAAAALPSTGAAAGPAKPQVLRFDKLGRPIDAEGNVIVSEELQPKPSSVKAATTSSSTAAPIAAVAATAAPSSSAAPEPPRPSKAAQLRAAVSAEAAAERSRRSAFFDPALEAAPARQRRGLALSFSEPGVHARQAAALRMRRARAEQASVAARKREQNVEGKLQWGVVAEVEGCPKGDPVTGAGKVAQPGGSVPVCEWWDKALLAHPPAETVESAASSLTSAAVAVAAGAPAAAADTASLGAHALDGYGVAAEGALAAGEAALLALLNPAAAGGGSSSVSSAALDSALTAAVPALRPSAITSLVLYPRRLPPRVPVPVPAPAPVMLTVAERAKARHIARQERARETQDLIRAGVLPTPEPRYTLKNFMRVAGADAVLAPTEVEAKAKAQIAQRQAAHDAANAARKLTKEEKAAKLKRKWADPEGTQTEVRVYRVGDLAHGKWRYKVEKNARQYELTGVVLLQPECNVVVVEGGPTALRKYHNVLVRRVKWGQEPPPSAKDSKSGSDTDDDDDDDDNGEGDDKNEHDHTSSSSKGSVSKGQIDDSHGPPFGSSPHRDAVLLWRGRVSARAFRAFSMEGAGTRAGARAVLERAGVPQYWDLALEATK